MSISWSAHFTKPVSREIHGFSGLSGLFCTTKVPDVAVFAWDRIPFTPNGDIPDDFLLAPDWAVEILSPDQSSTKPIDKLLHSLEHETQLGWLVDPDDRAVVAFLPTQPPKIQRGADLLTMLAEIPLALTADELFGWLRVGR